MLRCVTLCYVILYYVMVCYVSRTSRGVLLGLVVFVVLIVVLVAVIVVVVLLSQTIGIAISGEVVPYQNRRGI